MADEILLSCVILTMGNRPEELERAVRSVHDQEDVHIEIVVVGNGAQVPGLPVPVKAVRLPENVGIPAGRNRAIEASSGDVVLVLDDDGWYPSRRLGVLVRDAFQKDPTLGVLSFRISDPTGRVARRHVPRLRAGDPMRSSEVTTFNGGTCAIRRECFDRVGGLPEEFVREHEEIDFAWRAMDLGYHIRYEADAVMGHPVMPPTRRPDFLRLNARNRVWLARRNLPWSLATLYLADWIAITLIRERSLRDLRLWFRGFAEGWRTACGPRRPISWRTAWAMTRAGRPPVF